MPGARGGRAATISLSLARDARAAQLHRAGGTHTVHRKYILGEIDADEDNGRHVPSERVDESSHFRSWHLLPCAVSPRLVRDGEVRFMRREAARHAGAG